MTTEELKKWIEDERIDCTCDISKAEQEFDGNRLWYLRGKRDAMTEIIEKVEYSK